jgi:GntR family transcriptional regulator
MHWPGDHQGRTIGLAGKTIRATGLRENAVAHQPMYQQIADTIQRQIDEGELERGQQLPTELEMRETFNASRNTVRDAIKRLANLGLVEIRPGQGTFVTARVDPFVTILSGDPDPKKAKGSVDPESASYLSEVAEKHRKASKSKPRVEIQKPAPREVMLRLRIGEEDQVVVRHEERFIDGIPWSLVTSFYPMKLVTLGVRVLPHWLRPERGTDARNGQHLPRRQEPVHL